MKLVNEGDRRMLGVMQDAADKLGMEVISYSGRGMYGESCVAIVVRDTQDVLEFGAEMGRHEHYHGMPQTRTDNMGLDMVVYWPLIRVTG